MKKNDEELLRAEEAEHTLLTLAQLTQSSTIHWLYIDHKPLAMMPTKDVDEAYAGFHLKAMTMHNSQTLNIEIIETLSIPSGIGTLSLQYTPERTNSIHYSITSSTPQAPSCFLTEAVLLQLSRDRSILTGKTINRYKPYRFSYRIRTSPITTFIRPFLESGSFIDFHRFVFSSVFEQSTAFPSTTAVVCTFS